MSFSKQLTDLYHLLNVSNQSLEYVYTQDFDKYLRGLSAEDFASNTFVYGYETRDIPLGSMDDEVLKYLELNDKIYKEKFEDQFKSDDKLMTIYNIGLINSYLYFCEREEILTEAPNYNETLKNYLSEKKSDYVLPSESSIDIKTLNVNRSVEFLRKATKLSSDTMDISKGIYTYHVIRAFEYIFSIFSNYIVNNDNKPIDLDSFYVFSDQLESDELWLELARQMKVKFNVQ